MPTRSLSCELLLTSGCKTIAFYFLLLRKRIERALPVLYSCHLAVSKINLSANNKFDIKRDFEMEQRPPLLQLHSPALPASSLAQHISGKKGRVRQSKQEKGLEKSLEKGLGFRAQRQRRAARALDAHLGVIETRGA